MTSEPTYPILPGAEPFSSPGGAHGALVVHGFTGSPQSMRGMAEAFAGAGHTVELPRLPGHGTAPEDLQTTRWEDWTATVQAAYRELAARCDQVVVAGLSMGGTLALWLAVRQPEIAGLVLINPAIGTPETGPTADALRGMFDGGMTVIPGVGGDIADPDAPPELAYADTPVAPAISLLDASLELTPRLGEITIPTLLFHSLQDHVVAPSASAAIANGLGGPVELVELSRSFHVATLDFEHEQIEHRSVAFAASVFAAHAAT